MRAQTIHETRELWHWLARREGDRRLLRGELIGYDGLVAVAWGGAYDFANREVAAQMKEAGWDDISGHLWEADHIIPVIEGGGGCTPDGYRTLCLACHRRETALLAGRLAARRAAEKASRTPELQLTTPLPT